MRAGVVKVTYILDVFTTGIIRLSRKFIKIIFPTHRNSEVGFFFSIYSSVEPGRVVFEQKLRKINAHQDQKHLSNKQPICEIWMSVKPFQVSVFNLIKITTAFAAVPAADWMRPTNKHAEVPLDSNFFRLWLTGRSAPQKTTKIPFK